MLSFMMALGMYTIRFIFYTFVVISYLNLQFKVAQTLQIFLTCLFTCIKNTILALKVVQVETLFVPGRGTHSISPTLSGIERYLYKIYRHTREENKLDDTRLISEKVQIVFWKRGKLSSNKCCILIHSKKKQDFVPEIQPWNGQT